MYLSRYPLVLFVVLVTIYTVNGNCCCKPISFNVDFSKPCEALPVLKKLIKDVLTSNNIPELSPCAKDFLDSLVTISENSKCINTVKAFFRFITSSWGEMNRLCDNPSLYMFSKMIDTSVCSDRGKVDMVNALNTYSAVMIPLLSQYERMAAINMNCKCIPEALPTLNQCPNNGYTSRAKKAIRLYGGFLPKCITDAAVKLYDSENDDDRFIATMFAFGLLPEVANMFDKHNQNNILESLYIVLDDRAGPECCNERLGQLRKLSVSNSADVRANSNKIIDNLMKNCCSSS